MVLHAGDPVVHWMHGFGHVIGMEERVISERKSVYYAIAIRDMTVWVPDDDQLAARLRPPSTKKEFTRLFGILRGGGEPLPADRQERRLCLEGKLKDGQAASLCRILRDLTSFRQGHPLNDNDQNLMKRSRQALLSEWSHAHGISEVEADKQLHRMLETGKPGEEI